MGSSARGIKVLERLSSRLLELQEIDVNVNSSHIGVHNHVSELKLSASVSVQFRRIRPSWKLHGVTTEITPGRPDSGAPYGLLSDSRNTTLSLSIMNGGKPEIFGDVSEALEALRGVTRGTANIVPDLIIDKPFEEPQWNPSKQSFIPYLSAGSILEPEELFDGHQCYLVKSVQKIATWTI